MKVDVHDTYISKMETGAESPPSRKVALDLAAALGIRKKSRRWLDFLLAAGVASAEDMEGFTLVEGEDGEAEEEVDKDAGRKEPEGGRPEVDRSNQRASAPSTLYQSPISTSDQEILMHRLAALKKKVEAAEKNLRDIREELLEIEAIAVDMFGEDESHAPTTGGV